MLFALVPYGISALLQVIARREAFWLDRIGILGGALVAFVGWQLTQFPWLLALVVGAPFVALIDFRMRKAHTD